MNVGLLDRFSIANSCALTILLSFLAPGASFASEPHHRFLDCQKAAEKEAIALEARLIEAIGYVKPHDPKSKKKKRFIESHLLQIRVEANAARTALANKAARYNCGHFVSEKKCLSKLRSLREFEKVLKLKYENTFLEKWFYELPEKATISGTIEKFKVECADSQTHQKPQGWNPLPGRARYFDSQKLGSMLRQKSQEVLPTWNLNNGRGGVVLKGLEPELRIQDSSIAPE